MRVLITGAAGFIGSVFIKHVSLSQPEWEILALDKLGYASDLRNIEKEVENRRISFVRADISSFDEMRALFDDFSPDIVINFAAESHVDNSIESPLCFIKSNIDGVAVLLEESRRKGVLRFHQVSTDEVYGDMAVSENRSFTESDVLKPSSVYSASKASADLLVLSYKRTYGLPVSISRSSNNYGAYQHPEKLIPKTIVYALEGKKIPVYGSGENVRSWISAELNCRAIEKIVRSKRAEGEVFNIAAGYEISNIALIKKILSLMGKSESLISFVPDRAGHDRKYSVSKAKISSLLDFPLSEDFDDELERTICWYKSNRWWWENKMGNI